MMCKFFTSLFPSEEGVVDSNWSEADKLAITSENFPVPNIPDNDILQFCLQELQE